MNAGVAHLVERELPKLEVAGSTPVARLIWALVVGKVISTPVARYVCKIRSYELKKEKDL